MPDITQTVKKEITIKFAGDSGDGMQLTGSLFTDNTALTGSDLATFPDFPAEIRAPVGTLAGVSGFQLHFGSTKIYTPGDLVDVLVAMNAAALKANIKQIKRGGTVIANDEGFDKKNLRLAKYDSEFSPLDDNTLDGYEVYKLPISKLTKEALIESPLGTKEKDRCKNMFVLGFLLWRYSRSLDSVEEFLQRKFGNNKETLDANLNVLKAGYHFGETTETFTSRYEVKAAKLPKGVYRSITGNEALVLGLIAAAAQSKLSLFYGSYPITPASDILHGLAKYKKFGVKTFQAEDEIAAICSAIGASYGGDLAITGTSGPGLALKGEGMGLALMLEIPLVILNIQRGGPSTGLPTKTEQSDLLMAMYGRNGDSPVAVISAQSPTDAFTTAFEACKIAIEHMTPVILLSDGYIANGAEPWMIPDVSSFGTITPNFAKPRAEDDENFLPYVKDENHVRKWAIPGTKGLGHRVGGLEKEANTGNVSYDAANHEYMVKTRAAKIDRIAEFLPDQQIDSGPVSGDILVLGWGSTFGVIKSAVADLLEAGHQVSHTHLRYINPLPKNIEKVLRSFKRVIIPEMNNGQLCKVIRDRFLIDVISYHKIQGIPISSAELYHFLLQNIES